MLSSVGPSRTDRHEIEMINENKAVRVNWPVNEIVAVNENEAVNENGAVNENVAVNGNETVYENVAINGNVEVNGNEAVDEYDADVVVPKMQSPIYAPLPLTPPISPSTEALHNHTEAWMRDYLGPNLDVLFVAYHPSPCHSKPIIPKDEIGWFNSSPKLWEILHRSGMSLLYSP